MNRGFAAQNLFGEFDYAGQIADAVVFWSLLSPEDYAKTEATRTRYLRININLEVRDKHTAEAVKARIPELRDTAIMTLSEKSVEDLTKPGGKINLRAEVFKRLEDSIPDGRLMNVYFSDLVIQ